MPEEPTLGEVARRLDSIAAQLTGIVERLERRDTYVEENFIRRQVYTEARRADQAMVSNLAQDIGALQKERDTDAGWRRQVLLTMAVLAISTLVSIALAVANLRG